MEKIIRTALIVCCALGILRAQSQNVVSEYPDTLVVKTENQTEILISFQNIRNEDTGLDAPLWRSILGIMESSLESASKSEGVRVSYEKVQINKEERARISVDDFGKESDIFWIDGEGMRHQESDRIEFVITLPKVKVEFSLNSISELEAIKELDIQSIWDSRSGQVDKPHVLYNGTGNVELGTFRIKEMNETSRLDILEFAVGVGMGFYRNQFVPDLSYDVSFHFMDRFGKPRFKFGFLYTQSYFMEENNEGDFDIDLNGFLSAYWTMASGTDKEYGIGFGYLVNQNGSFYKGDTFKMSVFNRKASKTSLTPELVFTDGFKKAFPALRFGLTF